MKDYPRIKRLSTIGIIHHQNFDYEFNSFRTDFVGEGGAGKSIIADLLQLICIGTTAFHSPTNSNEPRKSNTLILRTEGKGTDMGYAFLNIEKTENQYLVIGIYLESSGASNMFIIQNGNDFNPETNLTPFSRLLGVADFQKDNIIFPIQELKEHIQNYLNLTCDSWDRTSNYHKILFNNNILPLDLSLNNRTLEDYAKIIQAFSRESLDMSKSRSLQSFLFGDDKEKEFIKKFYNTVEELNEDTKQFENNLEEIESLTEKQMQLSKLLNIKKTKEDYHKAYLITSYNYYNSHINKKLNELRIKLNEYNYSIEVLPLLKETIREKTTQLGTELEKVDTQWEEAFKNKTEWESKITKKRRFSSWMKAFKCSPEEIINKYQKYQKSKDTINKINELKEILSSKNLLSVFNSKEYTGKSIISQLELQIQKLNTELITKNKLKSLNNIDDKNSLAHWALQQNYELSKEEEAIIRKYQNENLKVEIPTNTLKRYIPKPEELLSNIKPYKNEENGFWLSLNGVIEFFSTDFSPIFNTSNKDDIKKYFQQETKSIQNDIIDIEKKIEEKKILKNIFEELENPDNYLKAWNSQVDLSDQLETHEMYEVSYDEFNELLNLYNLNSLDEQYNETNIKYKKLNDYRDKLKLLKQNLENELKIFVTVIQKEEIEDLKNKYIFSPETHYEVQEFLSSLKGIEDYYSEFTKLYTNKKTKYQETKDIIQLDKEIIELTSNKNEIYAQNPELLQEYSTQTKDVNEEERTKLHQKYHLAQSNYNQEYNLLARQYLKNTINRFEETGDFQKLCEEILPSEIFNNIYILEKEIIDKIDKYLRDINLKNKRLNSRKLQKLATIVEEVANEVSKQRHDIRQIHNFLNSEDKKITGGHKVSLDDDKEDSFSPGWMNIFTENINKDMGLGMENSLFESEKGITNDLEKYPSLASKLLEAFYRSGGSRNLKPKIEELLNPKSYYNLKFSIKTSKGKKNAGSTSQTYAAITLLCIGKLSLLNKQSKNKFIEAIRFMAIDEAEGLGSNFDMLYNIARANDYQILSLSINPNKVDTEKQNIYLLHNSLEDENVNYPPIPIFGLSKDL